VRSFDLAQVTHLEGRVRTGVDVGQSVLEQRSTSDAGLFGELGAQPLRRRTTFLTGVGQHGDGIVFCARTRAI
jgi:hypothetical protein